MNITFFGTGGAFNHEHGNNVALLNFNDTNLLLDCGHTASRYIEQITPICSINNIWISHMHGDHVGGLEEIAFRNRYLYNGRKINLFAHSSFFNDLKIYFESTTKFTNEGVSNINDFFNVYVVESQFEINKEKFIVKNTDHIKDMPSFMLEGKNFIFTGDTKFIDWTKENLDDIDFIFHDTQLHKYGNDVHSTLDDMLKLPQHIRKKIYCMHYGYDILDFNTEILESGMNYVTSYKTINL